MLNKVVAVSVAMAVISLAGSALAAKMPPPNASEKFSRHVAVDTKPLQTRDWSEMDTNKDHLISPDEMTKWMQAHATRGASSTKQN